MDSLPNLATDAPLWLTLLTVGVNAVVGALRGYPDPARHWDIVGGSMFALLMGLGGGFIRDVLIGNLPAESLRSPWFVVTVLNGDLPRHPDRTSPRPCRPADDPAQRPRSRTVDHRAVASPERAQNS